MSRNGFRAWCLQQTKPYISDLVKLSPTERLKLATVIKLGVVLFFLSRTTWENIIVSPRKDIWLI